MKRVRWMEVVSERYTTSSGAWGLEPPEDAVDYALVRTHSRARARVLAVRWWRRMHGKHGYRFEQVSNGENPFRGLKVDDLPTHCEECGKRWDDCSCHAEWSR